ncbi:MAG: 3-methyl-2-oxobutanoate dehydrogenase subunit VorB [Planctomycetes bacterium]|nr:3-methyl-2-oxobutanoate dehydrogenase subunit VorB [Planctomycetota bacterium]
MSQERILTAGNEAAGEAAIHAGCRFYYGYPITPQNELTAHMARRMPEVGGTFIQAESEIAAINMVLGTAATGRLAMTSSSSPGISLKQEGISYLVGCELPAVVINVQRGGPGLGDISPAQGDYFQAVKGGGHGDYNLIVLAPDSVQETYDLTRLAFELAAKYRTVVMILSDARVGQLMEPAVFRGPVEDDPDPKPWALTGAKGRPRNIVRSFFLKPGLLAEHNERLQAKFRRVRETEVRFEEIDVEDADAVLVAYGTSSRVSKEALHLAAEAGLKLGLFRPQTLWPFPTQRLRQLAERGKALLAVEMSAGQMVEDVRLAAEGRAPVGHCGRPGGAVPTTDEVIRAARTLLGGA